MGNLILILCAINIAILIAGVINGNTSMISGIGGWIVAILGWIQLR